MSNGRNVLVKNVNLSCGLVQQIIYSSKVSLKSWRHETNESGGMGYFVWSHFVRKPVEDISK